MEKRTKDGLVGCPLQQGNRAERNLEKIPVL